LGGEQVSRVRSHPHQTLKHLVLAACAPEDLVVRHWRGGIVTFRDGAADPYRPSMRHEVEPRPDRLWRTARLAAEEKLGRPLDHLPQRRPFALGELLDEEAPLGTLIAPLRPQGKK